jgi:hypothetical protein
VKFRWENLNKAEAFDVWILLDIRILKGTPRQNFGFKSVHFLNKIVMVLAGKILGFG